MRSAISESVGFDLFAVVLRMVSENGFEEFALVGRSRVFDEERKRLKMYLCIAVSEK